MNKRAALVAVAILGCGVDSSSLDTGLCGLAVNTAKQGSYVDTTIRYAKKQVSVCWINPQDGTREDMDLVRQIIDDGWDRYIALDFVWSDKPCGGCEDIRILIADQRPYSISDLLKYISTNAVPTMSLNLTFQEWDSGCRASEEQRQFCISRESNHEFGHLLGFVHEQNRPDTPEWCVAWLDPEDAFDGQAGDVMSPEWDEESIMNYCAQVAVPSPTDILTAQKIYGPEDQ